MSTFKVGGVVTVLSAKGEAISSHRIVAITDVEILLDNGSEWKPDGSSSWGYGYATESLVPFEDDHIDGLQKVECIKVLQGVDWNCHSLEQLQKVIALVCEKS